MSAVKRDEKLVVSSFRQKVFDATSRVPKGKVVSYGELANKLNTSARAIGGALRHNPFAPSVPCHRVVSMQGHLHGFKGSQQDAELLEKKHLLQQEGVLFVADSFQVQKDCFHFFEA